MAGEIILRDRFGICYLPSDPLNPSSPGAGRLDPVTFRAMLEAYRENAERDIYGFERMHAGGFEAKTIVDFGASWGLASRVMRFWWPEAFIYAVEGDPKYFSWLQKNLKAPKLCTVNCFVVGFAGTDKALEGTCRWPKLPHHFYLDSLRKFDAPVRSVADIFSNEMKDVTEIDLLKIDIEGGEPGVLAELGEIGVLQKTRRIVGEWHGDAVARLKGFLPKTHDCRFVPAAPSAPWQSFVAILRK